MNFRPALFLLLMVSCVSLPDPRTQEWDQEEFQRGLDRGDTVVDLRTAAEAASGRLPGAILVDYWSSDFGRFLIQADPKRPYLVYCAHGIRGREAVEKMRSAGFVEVHNLAGGLVGWKEHP